MAERWEEATWTNKSVRPKNANAARTGDCVAKKEEESGRSGDGAAEKPAKLSPKKALRKALKDKLNDGGANLIAAALVKQTTKGEKLGADLLMTLVMNKKDEDGTAKKKKKKRSGPDLLELLASEPKWVDEPDEAEVDVDMGAAEQEEGKPLASSF
jgi:hypothetical protein